MKKRRFILWTLVFLFVFGVAIPVGVAFAARPSVVDPVVDSALEEGISYPYQRSTFYDTVNDYNHVWFVENYWLKFNSSQYGEEWQPMGWTYAPCAGSHNFSIFYDGNYTHVVYVNASFPAPAGVYYGMVTPNSTGGIDPVASPGPVANATVGCRVIEPMVMVDSLNTYIMVVWTQHCPLAPSPQYVVYASIGAYNTTGAWEVLVEPTDELTGATNSRFISATQRFDGNNSVYVIHAENKSLPFLHYDTWYLVGNNFNGSSGTFEADQWIMDAVTPVNSLYEGYYYSTASIWEKPEIQAESVHIVYTQNDTLGVLPGLYNTTHDWADFVGEDWGVHTSNLTEVGQTLQEPVLARLNASGLKYLYGDHTGEVGWMRYRDFNCVALTWSNSTALRQVDWEEDQIQMAWNASSPLGYDWLNVSGEDFALYYDWFGDQESVEAGVLGAELLEIVLPLLMAVLALLATLVAGARLSSEPKITLIVGMMAAALVGAIAFLVVNQIVGGL